MTLEELCRKDVIDLGTGANLGRVDDLVFTEENAQVTHLILYGRLKLFGLLGREEDVRIPWQDIRKVGSDVLLVETKVAPPKKEKKPLAFLHG